MPIRWAQSGEFVRVYVANSASEGVGEKWTWRDTFQNYDADYGWYEGERTQLGEMSPASQRMGRRDECMTSGASSSLVWASCWNCFHTIRRVGVGLICCLFWRKLGSCHKKKSKDGHQEDKQNVENEEKKILKEEEDIHVTFILTFFFQSPQFKSSVLSWKQSKPHWKNNNSLNILLGISTGLFKPLLLLLFLHWRFNTVSLLWVIHVFYAARGDINQKHGMPSKVWGALLPTTVQGGYRWCDLISEGALSLAAWGKKKGMLKTKNPRGAVLNSG